MLFIPRYFTLSNPGITLKEADIFKYDDTIGKTQELNLSEHPINEPTLHSLLFGKVGKF